MSSRRQKRNVKELFDVNKQFDGTFGIGNSCGASLGGFNLDSIGKVFGKEREEQCNAITSCSCGTTGFCECTLEWWAIGVLALVALLIIVAVFYCLLSKLRLLLSWIVKCILCTKLIEKIILMNDDTWIDAQRIIDLIVYL